MKELKFIHITKTGGTSIEKNGLKYGMKWGMYHKEYGWHHNLFPNVRLDLKQKYDWFMVVRNPYERLISELYCRWGGPQPAGRILELDNNSINLFLKKKLLHVVNNHKICNGHYFEQHKYFDNDIKINIIHFENLEKEFDLLMKKYKLNVKLDNVYNESIKPKKITVNDNSLTKFTVNDLSEELINLINDIYDKDFEMFGYKKINI